MTSGVFTLSDTGFTVKGGGSRYPRANVNGVLYQYIANDAKAVYNISNWTSAVSGNTGISFELGDLIIVAYHGTIG